MVHFSSCPIKESPFRLKIPLPSVCVIARSPFTPCGKAPLQIVTWPPPAPQIGDREPGFLAHLADHGRDYGLARFHMPAGERQPTPRVCRLRQAILHEHPTSSVGDHTHITELGFHSLPLSQYFRKEYTAEKRGKQQGMVFFYEKKMLPTTIREL